MIKLIKISAFSFLCLYECIVLKYRAWIKESERVGLTGACSVTGRCDRSSKDRVICKEGGAGCDSDNLPTVTENILVTFQANNRL